MINEKSMKSYRELYENLEIPEIYPNKFPLDFTPDIQAWTFHDDKEMATFDIVLTQEEIDELTNMHLISKIQHLYENVYRIKRLRILDIELAPEKSIDAMNNLKDRFDNGEFRKEDGTLDRIALNLEFARLYKDTCTQRCPHCFNQEDDFYASKIIEGHELLHWNDVKKIILIGKRLGLEAVRFLGIGEIFKISNLFDILDDLKHVNIKIGIFTKGTALGDNVTAKKCGYEGVETAEDLVKKLSKYNNVTILLGANSFVPEVQDKMVGCGKDGGVTNYTRKRDNALKLLVKYRFNDPLIGKRLGLIAAPVTPQTSDETIVMYEWAMRRNIPIVTIPTMVSGKGSSELEWLLGQFDSDSQLIERYDKGRKMTKEERYTEWVIDFYTDINLCAIRLGLTDLATLKKEGIAGYAGITNCQQKYNGMYLRLPGAVQECPGRCVGAEVADDVRNLQLITIWVGSRNYDRPNTCRSLCSVKMKDITGRGAKVCDCCKIYDNVGSIPPETGAYTLERLEKILSNENK